MNRRVVITGVGMVTPLGAGKDAFFQALCSGVSGISFIDVFDTSRFISKQGGLVRDFSPKDFISLRNMRKMDHLSLMTTAAARMALDDAGVAVTPENRDRVGMIFGTAFGNSDIAPRIAGIIFTEGPNRVNPILVPNTVMNAAAGHASIELGFRGINSTVNHREASAETALAYAATEIQQGRADVLLAGGADILSELFFEILNRFRALSPLDGGPEVPRPFDRRRNGPVAAEGAGIVCLESLERARNRGVTPYCEIAGWGMSAAPAPPTDWPADPEGPLLAMTRALTAANLSPDDIDYVSASANGGENLDALEAETLSIVFGIDVTKPFIGSLKGALGESYSSGGVRAAAMALSIQNAVIPPTLGLQEPIAELNFAADQAIETPLRIGLLNGFAPGGTFVSLVFKAVEPEA